MATLREKDISKIVSRETGRYLGMVDSTIKEAFEVIANELQKGNRVQIRGFGTFESAERAPRTGRNPHTGEAVPIPARKVPSFKPSKGLKEMVGGKKEW